MLSRREFDLTATVMEDFLRTRVIQVKDVSIEEEEGITLGVFHPGPMCLFRS